MSRALALALFALALSTGPALAEDPVKLGDPITVAEVTPVADILADPAAFEGKRVRVEGTIADVCPMMGCWMELAAAGDVGIRVKVEDGVIVIPKTATGREAVAEGVVTLKDLSRDEFVTWRKHLAEEKGETFDEASIGDGPYRLVQVQGSGIEIR